MRMHRTVATLIALAMMMALPLLGSSSATAADKTKREVFATGIEPKPNRFFIKGNVEGSYKKSKVVMERKPGGTKKWSTFKVFKTDNKSRFRLRVVGPGRGSKKVCYRVKVPSTKSYKTSYSQSLCIVRIG